MEWYNQFEVGKEILFINNISNCPVDYPSSNDTFLFTTDGGKTWDESTEFKNLINDFVTSQIVDGKYYVVLRKKMIVLEKK